MCDPKPGAANTCPGGYHCAADGSCDALCTPGGGECGDGYRCTPDGRCVGEDECVGLECHIVDCDGDGHAADDDHRHGVRAERHAAALRRQRLRAERADRPAARRRACCDAAATALPGDPLVDRSQTDEAGQFTLTDVPAGADVPLVITSGKWRRQITIPTSPQCADTALDRGGDAAAEEQDRGRHPEDRDHDRQRGRARVPAPQARHRRHRDQQRRAAPAAIHLYSGNGAGDDSSRPASPAAPARSPTATTLWNEPRQAQAATTS